MPAAPEIAGVLLAVRAPSAGAVIVTTGATQSG